ncbi:MAG: DUF5125 domain-containing protein [Bacteroidales bacterium]|nr:DUF5125 domain-containing protein [Bacteroidales bacterium]
MKKLLYIVLAAGVLYACQKKDYNYPIGTVDPNVPGPVQTITCDQSAQMGTEFSFSVSLEDQQALSTLKVELLFDETVVADTTIRTKATGTEYKGKLPVPFLINIPDGTATARFTAQNIKFGTSVENKDVAVSRPEFRYLTLNTVAGTSHRMEPKGNHVYEAYGDFAAAMDGFITTAPFGDDYRTLTFGLGASGIELNGKSAIPFANGGAGKYTISFNTKTWKGSPFVTLYINETEAMLDPESGNYAATLNLTKGMQMSASGYAEGFEDFILDPDFFTDDFKFNAADGLYKITIQLDKKFFLVEKMANQSDYASLSDGNAVWLIGANYGKPVFCGHDWWTSEGLCLAEVAPNVHQISFVAGQGIKTDNLNVKFFHQKGWGGEFGSADYATVNGGGLIRVGDKTESDLPNDDGNIYLLDADTTLEDGATYRFTLDLTAGEHAAVLTFTKVE